MSSDETYIKGIKRRGPFRATVNWDPERDTTPFRVVARPQVGMFMPVKCFECWRIYAGVICPCGRANVLFPKLVFNGTRLTDEATFIRSVFTVPSVEGGRPNGQV